MKTFAITYFYMLINMYIWPQFTTVFNDFVSQLLKDPKNGPHFTG